MVLTWVSNVEKSKVSCLLMPSSRRGYIALLSVLIISAVAASTVLILFITSLSTSLNSADTARRKVAKGLAEACAELALQILTSGLPSSCIGPACSEPQTLAQGTCTIDEIRNVSGTTWSIRTTGSTTIGGISKYLEVEANRAAIGAAATVNTWKECVNATVPCV